MEQRLDHLASQLSASSHHVDRHRCPPSQAPPHAGDDDSADAGDDDSAAVRPDAPVPGQAIAPSPETPVPAEPEPKKK